MIPLQPTSNFNVEATLNAHFAAALATFALPSWLATVPPVVLIPSDIALAAPCYAVFHIPVESRDLYQGRTGEAGVRTTRDEALMEISAWTSSSRGPWLAQLRTMTDLVKHWHNRHAQIVIDDYASDPDDAAATPYKINLMDIRENARQQDTDNPDLWRVRMLISYRWHYRA